MAVSLELSARLRADGWKVKIQDKERLEPPHVAILRGTMKWRWNLRTGGFMDTSPDPSMVDKRVVNAILRQHEWLCARWDEMYPSNPVQGND